MDTSIAATMSVHCKDNSIMTFKEFDYGLYYFDANSSSSNMYSTLNNAYLFLNTVASNTSLYTQRKIQGADSARALYQKLGHPYKAQIQSILQNNLIWNCIVIPDNTKKVSAIYRLAIATLKGKTVNNKERASQLSS